MRRDGLAPFAAWKSRMRDDQRHLVLFAVGGSPFCMEQVGAVVIAMVGSQDDDRLRREAESLQLVEHRRDISVHVAQAVKIEVMALVPTPFVRRGNPANQGVV